MIILISLLFILVMLGLAAFIDGIINAESVDPNEPFLRGDYDPRKQ